MEWKMMASFFGVPSNVNCIQMNKRNKLHLAVRKKKYEAVEVILARTRKVNQRDGRGRTALHLAIKLRSWEISDLLIKNGVNIDVQDGSGKTALHSAIKTEYFPNIKLLIKAKADVNITDASEKTALHLALENSNIPLQIVSIILSSVKDINARDCHWKTPLHYAALNYNPSAITLLLEAGADVNATDLDGKSALHHAVTLKLRNVPCSERLQPLLDYKAKINEVDNDLLTPLHVACLHKNAEAIKFLLANGADPHARDKNGKTVFHFACMHKSEMMSSLVESFTNTINILVEIKDMSINCYDYDGKAALHYVTDKSLIYMHQPLLNAGADINVFDINKKSIFDILKSRSDFTFISEKKPFDLAKHILKMKILKLWTRDMSLENIYNVSDQNKLEWAKIFERKCNDEIKILKTTKFDQSTLTYYAFLRLNPHDAVNYTRNENIVKIIQSGELINQLPIYGYFFKCQLLKAQQRNRLYDQIQERLTVQSSCFEKLPTLCISEIFKYLDNSALKLLLETLNPTETTY